MPDPMPKFKQPPLIETALSIQFPTIKSLQDPQIVLFWSELRDEFPTIEVSDPITTHRVQFGRDRLMPPPAPRIRLDDSRALRYQMTSKDECRMLQVQNGRLVFNWRKVEASEYPHWEAVKDALLNYWLKFREFLAREGIDSPQPNLWDVVYVNHIERGFGWEAVEDWPRLVPGLIGPCKELFGGSVSSAKSGVQVDLDDERGRLYMELTHGARPPEEGSSEEPIQLLNLTLTARGVVSEQHSVEEGLSLGHEAIVRNFATITSDEAHSRWERYQ